MLKLFVHIVTYNSERYIQSCLDSLLSTEDFKRPDNPIKVHVTDNNSTDTTITIIEKNYADVVALTKNSINLGFSGGHNQGFGNFINSDCDYILILNPDVKLRKDFFRELSKYILSNPDIGLFTPKLLRADESLNPLTPAVIDAAGMLLDNNLRHLDRGSDEIDNGQYDTQEFVFGGTGAALILSKSSVKKLILKGDRYDNDLYKIYPELKEGSEDRLAVFDEAFFAYREDAELCWRAGNCGLKVLYCPTVVAYHHRKVLPQRRSELPPEYNLYSVRNRFLMQIVNFSFKKEWRSLLQGLILRNVLVVIGVILTERRSLPGLLHVVRLFRRASERRKILFSRSHA